MKMSIKVCAAAIGSLAVAAGSLGVAMGGCGGSSAGSDTGSGTGSGSTSSTATSSSTGTGVVVTSTTAAPGTCSGQDDILEIVFSPMYSAVIPGSTAHSFVIPAIVAGVAADVPVTWTASSDAVVLPFTADPTTGGVLITMNSASAGGAVTIIASAGGSCGTATLNITPSTAAAWEAGAARYNDGVPIPMNPREVFDPDAGPGSLRIACTNCHAPKGEDAGMGLGFNDIAHTPEQTGGYSDQQLLAIVQNGEVPGWSTDAATAGDAGYFDTTITSFTLWHKFHQWNLTPAEQAGIVTYLRSLTPAAQTGTSNFGGFGGGGPPPDGGYHFPDGGMHHHHDGGFMHPGDAGTTPPTGDSGL